MINLPFLMSGNQFVHSSKLNNILITNSHQQRTTDARCVFSVKNTKSENYYQLLSEIENYKK